MAEIIDDPFALPETAEASAPEVIDDPFALPESVPMSGNAEPVAADEDRFGVWKADDRNRLQRFIDRAQFNLGRWWDGLTDSTEVGVDHMRAEPFRKAVEEGKIDGSIDDHWKMGGWSASLNNRLSAAAIGGDMEKLRSVVQEDRDVLGKVGDKLDLRDANLLEKGLKGAAASGVPMVESAALGAYASAIPGVGPVAGKSAVGTYWQQQGAGQFLRSFLRDKDLDALTPEKLSEYNKIAQAMGAPYAAIEFAVSSIPGMKALGSGVDQQVANYLFRKVGANPTVLQRIGRSGTAFAIRWGLESLVEEGGQGAVEEGAGQMLDAASKGDSKSILELVKGLDPEKLKAAFVESGVQSIPSVGVITAVGGGAAGVRNRIKSAVGAKSGGADAAVGEQGAAQADQKPFTFKEVNDVRNTLSDIEIEQTVAGMDEAVRPAALEAYTRPTTESVQALNDAVAALNEQQAVPEGESVQPLENQTENVPESGNEAPVPRVPVEGEPGVSATGIKHEAVNRQRAERGLPPLITPDRQTNQQQLDEALDVLSENPDAAVEIIAKVKRKPRALSPAESFILMQHETDLRLKFNRASAAVNQAVDEGRTGDVDDLMAVRDAISDQMTETEGAARASGSEAGRSLQARRRMLQDDFSLAAMETRLRAAKRGERLTPEESGKLADIDGDVQAAGQDLAQKVAEFGEDSPEARRAGRRLDAVKARFDGMTHALRAVERTEAAMNKAGRFLRPEQKRELSDRNQRWFSAEDAYNKALADFEAVPTEEGMLELQRLGAELLGAERSLAQFSGRLIKMTGGKMVSTMIKGNLLVFKSQMVNLLSNIQMQVINDVGQSLSASVDLVLSMARNKPRSVGFPSIVGRAEGAVSGLKRGVKELWTGARPGSSLHGEKGMREFHPLEAWKDLFNPSRMPVTASGKVSKMDYLKSFFEATLGVAPTVNFRGLGLGDHPFRESTYRSVVREQARLKKLKGKEKKYFLAHPDAETIGLALSESLASVYQNNDAFATKLREIIDIPSSTLGYLGDWVEAGWITPVAPYITTPINLAHIGLQLASPEYSSARAGLHAAKALRAEKAAASEQDPVQKKKLQADALYNRRRTYESVSRGVIGASMTIAAGAFVKAGLVSGPPDKDPKKRALQYATLPPGTFNIDGAKRLIGGGDGSFQPGDTYQDLNSMGFWGMILSVTASGKAAAERDGGSFDSYLQSRKFVLPSVGTAMLNMTVMRGGYVFMKALAEQEYGPLNRSFGSVWTSAALPNQLTSVVRAKQTYLPDVKGHDGIVNALKIAVEERNPLVDMNKLYPYRFDPLGQPIERTPEGAQAWVYHVFDPAKTAQISSDPAWNMIGKLYEKTGDTSVIPSMPSRNLAGEKLGPFEYERMMQFVGEERMKRMDRWVLNNSSWERRTDQQKIQVLEKLYREGSTIGRKRYIAEKVQRERDAKRRRDTGQSTYEDMLKIIHGKNQ